MEVRSAKEIWETALGELQIQVSKANYQTWFQKTIGLNYQENCFVVGVPSAFVAEFLDKKQRSLIEKALIGLTSADIQVSFQVNGRHHDSDTYHADLITSDARQASQPRFNPKYVFESFVEGNCNRMANAAALAVVQSPGQSYNPLFIYGGAGLGKTHLLHAIGHAAEANHIPVICVSAEQFTNEFVKAIKQRRVEEFQNKYRNTSMLLVDDIHFIGGKGQTEESFFHTFDELHNSNRQIVVTSDRPPKLLLLLDERLRSRFEWGLVVDIQPPDFETRLAILQAKAGQREVHLPMDVLQFVAQQSHPNVRELEGCLNRVIAYARLTRAPITLELANQALKALSGKGARSAAVTPGQVIAAVADSFGITAEDLIGRQRNRQIVLARQVAMYLLRQATQYSLVQIGREFGGRDHHIVGSACEKIASEIAANGSLRETVQNIQRRLYSTPG